MTTETETNNLTPQLQRETGLFPALKTLMAVTGGVIVGVAAAHGLHMPVPPLVDNALAILVRSEGYSLPAGWFLQLYLNGQDGAPNTQGRQETHPIAMLFTILGYNAASLYLLGLMSNK
jgi:hypothetical protein